MSTNIKIIIIGASYPLRGGLADMNEKLFFKFTERNINTVIYNFKVLYPNLLFPGKTQFSKNIKPKGLKFINIINSLNPISWIRVGLKIKKEKPDIILVKYWIPFLSPCLGTICRLIKSKNTKIISIIDNINPHEKRLGDKLLNRYFINSVDKFIVMSKNVEKDMRLLTNKPVEYTPHPIYNIFGNKVNKKEAKEFLNWDYNTNYILFFGLIRKYKGLDLLLEAMADDRIRKKNIKLYIAGEFYEDEKKYRDIIKKLKIETKVIINNNFIPKDEVKYYFSASDITAQTYKSATQSGITQISYNFDTPVIVSNVGGLAEIVNEGTGYVVNKNPKEIATAILDFFDNEKQEKLEKGILEEKKKYSWDILVDKILSK